MKRTPALYCLIAALLGLICALLRSALYAAAMDESGLLLRGGVLPYLLWLPVIAGAAGLSFAGKALGRSRPSAPQPASAFVSAAGYCILALGLFLSRTLIFRQAPSQLAPLRTALVWASIAAALLAAFCCLRGQKVFFLCHVVIGVFFAVHLVTRYQDWCCNPQILDFVFSLLAGICLLLFSYYRITFDLGSGSRRMLCAALAGILLCIPALVHGEQLPMYAAGAVWMGCVICTLAPGEDVQP